MNPVLEDRLAKLDELTLDHGAHSTFEEGFCATELISWLADEPFSDHPNCLSPVLGSFLRGWNDRTDDEGRQKLKPYLPRCIGTADDGQEEARKQLIRTWAFREALPFWLELSGAQDDAAKLQAVPEDATFLYGSDEYKLLRAIRERAWARRSEWRKKIRAAVTKALKEKGLSGKKAVAVAVAAAVAVAVAAAVAVAVAAAVAVFPTWSATHRAVKERLIPIYKAKIEEALEGNAPSNGFQLLEQLIDPSGEKAKAAA